MRILRIMGMVLGVVALALGLLWLLRSDPIGPIAGRAVSGEEAAYPDDWSFTSEHMTISLESRPDSPHSVTTICFVADGNLYVPAKNGSQKSWTKYVLDDPRVRLKVGDRVYPASATRVEPADFSSLMEAAAKKYPRLGESNEAPDDVWLFQISPPH